jgi:hypothetical protein
LFPVSVSAATVVMCVLVEEALDLPPTGFAGNALMLAATLLALAILEHWFLVLPLADAVLWEWALGESGKENATSQAPAKDALGNDPLPGDAGAVGGVHRPTRGAP